MKYMPRLLVVLMLLMVSVVSRAASPEADIQLGIQTWTLRQLNFDQVVEFAVKHGVKTLQLIPNHIDPYAPAAETKRKKEILEKNGLKAYTFGVAGTSLDPEKNRQLFVFAKEMGMKLIIVEPHDFKIFENLEQLAKEFDIRVAIHNHGIRSLYGNPIVVKSVIRHLDSRIGVCLDVGWITAAGFDAAKVFREYEGRVYDIHLKDKKVEAAMGDTVSTDTHIGEGSANYKGLIAELKKAKWQGVMAAETDSQAFALNPAEFVDKAKSFYVGNVQAGH